jgi:hypothetical protein
MLLELAHDAGDHLIDAFAVDRALAQGDGGWSGCSLSRSNSARRPSRLMTVRSRSWTRSNVVKRPPQLVADAAAAHSGIIFGRRLSFTDRIVS